MRRSSLSVFRSRSAAAYAKQENNIPWGKPDINRLHSYQDLAELFFSQPPAVFTKGITGANGMRQESARDFSRYLAGQLPPHSDALYNATSLLGAHREENPRVE